MKKNNINKKNSYSRPFFGLVRHPEARCRGLAPYPVVLESLGLRGGAFMSKIENFGHFEHLQALFEPP